MSKLVVVGLVVLLIVGFVFYIKIYKRATYTELPIKVQTCKELSAKEAINAVKTLPEVKAYMQERKDNHPDIINVVKHSEDQSWHVGVGVRLSDHNSVSTWYRVGLCTGKLTKLDV